MKIQEIQEIVEKYNELQEHSETVIAKLTKLDSKEYDISRGIEEISIDLNFVYVTCDNTYRGCVDTIYFKFPISYLSMDDDELKNTVIEMKERREEKKRIEKEIAEKEERIKREERERQQYESLKKKFENT